MTTDFMDRLKAVKSKADGDEQTRENYSAYVADRVANGWTPADVDEYRAEVGWIMAEGTEGEKAAAREFWEDKAKRKAPEVGSDARIRSSIEAEKEAAS